MSRIYMYTVNMAKTKMEQALDLIKEKGIIRRRDLVKQGMSHICLYDLYKQGKVVRLNRGLYALSYDILTPNHSFAEVSKWIPHGVICLLSALQFHELTTQLPYQVWLALDRKMHKPTVNGLSLRIMRFSGMALEEGIEEHQIEGVRVKIYSPAKTVADCFKYRNKIGIDVAMEALKDCLRQKKATINDIWHYSKICRVSNVIYPYLEAV